MIRLAKGRIRPAVRDIQHQLPLAFLYPSIGGLGGRVNLNEGSLNEQTQFASTSYSTLQPSKKVNAEEAISYRKESPGSLEAALHYRKRAAFKSSNQTSSIDSHFNSASYIGTGQIERQNDTSQGGGEGDPKGKRPERQLNENKRQDVLLGRTFVRDIMKRSIDSAFAINEVELLEEVSETYFQYAENQFDLLDKLLPELALAFMHIGHDQRALTLLERTSRMCANSKAYTSTPLQSWKNVLAVAFTRGKYELTADFVKAASGGLNEEDDWAMLARFEALLLLRKFKPTKNAEANSIDVDQYWKEYEVYARKAPEIVFATLLKEQVKDGKVNAVRKTLIARQEHGYVIDKNIWRILLDIHPRARRKGLLDGFAADLNINAQQAFADAISLLTPQNDIRRMWLAFRMFGVGKDLLSKSNGWIPQFDTMKVVIGTFASFGTPEAAMKILLLAIDLDVQGDYTPSYLRISQELRRAGRPEDALVFASHMIGICLQNQIRPHSLDFHLPKPIVKPSRRCYRECLRACSELRDPIDVVKKAREILLDLLITRDTVLEVRKGVIAVFKAIMSKASWKQMSSMLKELTKHASKQCQEDGDTALATFIDALNSEGAVDQVIIARRERVPLSSHDVRENLAWVTKPHEISNFMDGYPNKTMHDGQSTPERRAASLLEDEEMSTDPHVHLTPRLTPMAYALRLRVFAVIRQDYGSAVIIYRYMIARGIKPTVHHIAPILEGLVMIDRLEDARAIRDGARQTLSDIDSSLRISAAIIRGHLSRNEWSAVQQELLEMRERRIYPDAFILSMVRTAQKHFRQSKSQFYDKKIEKLNESNVKAQKSMEPLLKEVEQETVYKVREEFDNHIKLQDQSDQSSIPSTQPLSKEYVSVQNATKFYQNLYQSKKELLAIQYLSNAMRNGVIPDLKLRSAIRNHGQLLEKRLSKIGLEMKKLIDFEGPFNQYPCEIAVPEDDTEQARISANHITHSRRRLVNQWGPIVRLWNENRKLANGFHPTAIERRQREKQAREDLLRLILDFYGSDRLKEEAKEKIERDSNDGSLEGRVITSTSLQ